MIENVPGAPLHDPVPFQFPPYPTFSSIFPLTTPHPLTPRVNYTGYYFTVAGHGGGADGNFNDWCSAMDIDWMTTKRALTQAVPPAYTELVGARLLAGMQRVAA